MAQYQFALFLTQVSNAAFTTAHAPGSTTPFSGIYRCTVCGVEAVSTYGHPLPPQNHHQHAPGLGPIQWQLIVAATHR